MMSEYSVIDKADMPAFRTGSNISKWDNVFKAVVGLVGTDKAIVVRTETLKEMRSLQSLVGQWGRREGSGRPWKLPSGYKTCTKSQRVKRNDKMGPRDLYIWVEEAEDA